MILDRDHPVTQSIPLPTAERVLLCIRHLEREMEADKKLPYLTALSPFEICQPGATCTEDLQRTTTVCATKDHPRQATVKLAMASPSICLRPAVAVFLPAILGDHTEQDHKQGLVPSA